jgi:peptide/nickel transport system ATP-binding protein/oligopeptide transport system ATP-binding protein
MTDILLRVEGLTKVFGDDVGWLARARGTLRQVRAVDDVGLDLRRGETLAVVGESGCGKSTLARLVLRLIAPSAGRVVFEGTDLASLSASEMCRMRRRMQIVFQDPFGSLSPRRSVFEIVGEPLEVFGLARDARQRREQVAALLAAVGLSPAFMDRLPRQFSGGQRQRIGIARAIAAGPNLIVADEPVSALDVSVQAQIVNLFQDLQERSGFSYLFIAHDLAVVRHIADRVMVMYLGRVVETGPKERVYGSPHHPYTQALLSAVPEPDPDAPRRRIVLGGDVPSPLAVPPGCAFSTRCPIAQDICRRNRPPLVPVAEGHVAACHFAAPNPIPIEGNAPSGSLSTMGR